MPDLNASGLLGGEQAKQSPELMSSTYQQPLAESFLLCSRAPMDREQLSSIVQNAPTWVRLGPDPRLRERAADALAATIVQRLEEPPPADRNQLALPL